MTGAHLYVASPGDTDSVTWFSRSTITGRFFELGCLAEIDDGPGGCENGHALDGISSVAFDQSGQFAYIASRFSGYVSLAVRDPQTGALRQLSYTQEDAATDQHSCYAEFASEGCVEGYGLHGATSVAVKDESVYVAASTGNSITFFTRSTSSGKLSLKGCLSDEESRDRDRCQRARALKGPSFVTVSPDGANVYVASRTSGAVAVFSRSGSGLTQLPGTSGCINRSGAHGCAKARGLTGAGSVAVSPDGKRVYVAGVSGNSVAVLRRDVKTGSLRGFPGRLGCFSYKGLGGCRKGRGLRAASGIAVTADGRTVYVSSQYLGDLAVFSRNAKTGLLRPSQCLGSAGSASVPCSPARALGEASSVATSPDSRYAYVTGIGQETLLGLERTG